MDQRQAARALRASSVKAMRKYIASMDKGISTLALH